METVSSADGTTLAFDQLGSGTPLVLVAGASCGRREDAALADALAEHFTVLNYDRRGRGDSTDTPPYSVDREVEDLEVMLSAAGGSATLVGLSSGAVLAGHAAAAGLPVGHLVMWEPPFRLDDDGRRLSREYAEQVTALLAEDRREEALELFLRVVGLPEEMIAGMHHSPYWATGVGLAPTLAYDAAILGDGAVPTESYARITAPTLVLAGGASPGWMVEAARAAAAAIGGSRFEVLDGQTHDVDGAALTAAVRSFVAAEAAR